MTARKLLLFCLVAGLIGLGLNLHASKDALGGPVSAVLVEDTSHPSPAAAAIRTDQDLQALSHSEKDRLARR